MTTPAQPETAHLVIRASAGTGKTFALSNRYLKLLRAGAGADTVLATTFTRKAAGEILERVLLRLARGARDEAGAKKLAAELHDSTLTLAEARRMLGDLCAALHRVSISTIDSFFSRVAHGFRHELNIPAGAVIVGQDEPAAMQLRLQAIDAMLADEKPQVLVDLMRRLHHDQAQRSVTSSIDRIVSRLYEAYQHTAHTPEVWATLSADAPLESAELSAAIDRLGSWAEKITDKNLAKALHKTHETLLVGDWQEFLSNGLGKIISSGQGTYYKKPIPPHLIDVYTPLIEHAKAELVARVVRQTKATFELLRRFDAHFTVLRQANRVLLYSDLPLRLSGAFQEARGEDDADLLTEIHCRLDARVGHLLIDEFQDTSIEQWGVLRPFAEEVCSYSDDSRSFFCVGDTKQSIYGWRGGTPAIFEQIMSELRLPPQSLRKINKSWRSAPVVLDAVNRVFSTLGNNPALTKHHDLAAAWQKDFETHTAQHTQMAGYVELATSTAASDAADEEDENAFHEPPPLGADDEDAAAPTAHERFAAGKVYEIARLSPGKTIGVLVSTNDAVRRLIHLLHELKLPASGEGGNAVTDDPAVGCVLAALTMADHPGHTIAAYHVLRSPLGPIVGLRSIELNDVCAAGLRIRRELIARGYAGLLAWWAKALALSCSTRGVVRLTQLVELADAYGVTPTLRPRDFVEYVIHTPVEEPTPAPIRVMTVYRAKGLEFDAVVLPQLDRRLLMQNDLPVYLHRSSPTEPIDAVYRGAAEAVRKLCPPMEEAYQQERDRRLRDDLCALYVAMTRARQALHMIIEPLQPRKDGSPRSKGLSFAAILRSALAASQESYDGGETLYEAGDVGALGGVAQGQRRAEPRRMRVGLAGAMGGMGGRSKGERVTVGELVWLGEEREER